jgi:uncharacterized protein (DUF1501 family)
MTPPNPRRIPPQVSRRGFLQGATALGAAVALGACSDDPIDRRKGAADPSRSAATNGDGILVVVTLSGGNDSLNTVAPVDDPTYRSLRAGLALDQENARVIGEGFALHPALARCTALWDDDRLAVVHGVGFDGLDRSHFHCMDVWQAGDPSDLSTGWLGRWLDAVGTGPLDAIAVGRVLPLSGRGGQRSAAVVPCGPLDLPGGDLHELLVAMTAAETGRPPLHDLVARSTADLLTVEATVAPVMADVEESETLLARLGTVAALIEAGVPTRVYAVDLRGFDTHAGQAETHATLLGELDEALGTFLERMARHPVTVLVSSEFGRRVVPNASGGTDHGGAGTVLVAGRVRPGHHGEPPPLDDLVDGDLRTTVDFRSVYGGLLEGVLGIEASAVLADPPKPLALV